MKAVRCQGPRKMSVSTQVKPKIKSPTDAFLRSQRAGSPAAICTGCDGRTLLGEGTVVGHKIMGVFDEVREAAQSVRKAIVSSLERNESGSGAGAAIPSGR